MFYRPPVLDANVRWIAYLTVFLSLLVVLHSGSTYLFATYSGQLKEITGWSARVSMIGSFADAGYFMALLPGIFYAYFGQAWSALVFGAILCGAYGGVVAVLSNSSPSAALLCVLYFLVRRCILSAFILPLSRPASFREMHSV
jgi:hypothetical protein